MEPKAQGAKTAPIVILGCMFLIGFVGLTIVGVSHCRREERLMDPQYMRPNDPNRLDLPKPAPAQR